MSRNLLKSELIKTKENKPLRKIAWPDGIEAGKWLEWEVIANKQGKEKGWLAKQGKVVAVFKRYMVVHTGRYKETITLVDVHLGLVRFI